jgi:CheY-like chemotaxis protein
MNKKRILVIDDEVSFTRLVKLNLEVNGPYEVCVENRGKAALASAQKFKPDFIFLDIILPDMDGGDVASQLKDDPKLKNVPIVFLTATVRKKEVESRKGLIGGHSFIAKPAGTDDLISAIEQHLVKKRLTNP